MFSKTGKTAARRTDDLRGLIAPYHPAEGVKVKTQENIMDNYISAVKVKTDVDDNAVGHTTREVINVTPQTTLEELVSVISDMYGNDYYSGDTVHSDGGVIVISLTRNLNGRLQIDNAPDPIQHEFSITNTFKKHEADNG